MKTVKPVEFWAILVKGDVYMDFNDKLCIYDSKAGAKVNMENLKGLDVPDATIGRVKVLSD